MARRCPLSAETRTPPRCTLRRRPSRCCGNRGRLGSLAEAMPVDVTSWESAPLIYDFGGFPEELNRIEYPAQGDAALARGSTCNCMPPDCPPSWTRAAGSTMARGFRSALRGPTPIPVVQVSLPAVKPRDAVRSRGGAPSVARGWRDVAGSGGIVHNLRRARHSKNKELPRRSRGPPSSTSGLRSRSKRGNHEACSAITRRRRMRHGGPHAGALRSDFRDARRGASRREAADDLHRIPLRHNLDAELRVRRITRGRGQTDLSTRRKRGSSGQTRLSLASFAFGA